MSLKWVSPSFGRQKSFPNSVSTTGKWRFRRSANLTINLSLSKYKLQNKSWFLSWDCQKSREKTPEYWSMYTWCFSLVFAPCKFWIFKTEYNKPYSVINPNTICIWWGHNILVALIYVRMALVNSFSQMASYMCFCWFLCNVFFCIQQWQKVYNFIRIISRKKKNKMS